MIQTVTGIVSSACGESHSLLVTGKGEVLGFGSGQQGQLGLGDYVRVN
jgi:alpha-tubulin suppressor-like RCC1 family protein